MAEGSRGSDAPSTSETDMELKYPKNLPSSARPSMISSAVKLVHVQDPQKSSFSRTKKQCDLWEYLWGSSLLLSSFLSLLDYHGQSKVKGGDGDSLPVSVLEVGGGHGLCSLVAAIKGGKVLMTDLVADATKLCRRSAELNQLRIKSTLSDVAALSLKEADNTVTTPTEASAKGEGSIEFGSLNWEKIETVPKEQFDLVIGSDVLFFRGCVKHVAKTIHRALKEGGSALVADPCRLNTADFAEQCREVGLKAELYTFHGEFVKQHEISTRKRHSLQEEGEGEDQPTEPPSNDFVKLSRAKLIVIQKLASTAEGESVSTRKETTTMHKEPKTIDSKDAKKVEKDLASQIEHLLPYFVDA